MARLSDALVAQTRELLLHPDAECAAQLHTIDEDMDDIRGEELAEILKAELPGMKIDVFDRAKNQFIYYADKTPIEHRALVEIVDDAWQNAKIMDRTPEEIEKGIKRRCVQDAGYRVRAFGKKAIDCVDVQSVIEHIKKPVPKPDPLILNFEDSLI